MNMNGQRECTRCHSKSIVKHGFQRNRKQLYLCKGCGFQFVENPQNGRGRAYIIREQFISAIDNAVILYNMYDNEVESIADALLKFFIVTPRPQSLEDEEEARIILNRWSERKKGKESQNTLQNK